MVNDKRIVRTVDVVVDFVCVHCCLAFTRFRRAANRYRATGADLRVRLRPFQLRPDAPAEGEALFAVHVRERGERFAREVAADSTIGAADGLDIRLRDAIFTNTAAAHRLVAVAAEQGLAEEMTERLFRAYFTDGVNIAEPDVLDRLAAEVGVASSGDGGDGGGGSDNDALSAALAEVRASGVTTVPLFRFDDGTVLEGEPAEAEFTSALTR
ncbi:DsbA family protein [Saccharomonospora xinjiangensis]|uniref:Putative dithiol-disulfide isomerase involved in polyketide biosynthesis n=1 Tax=Saccharomonospora xinjiangensis XJ-54 TaxID=882086 RepID=I0UWZ9_9PSEU|nr:DsbA family protein [Saccharomonospora xinjiangensis]EID52402.1 putative dithiol-disulfide isomerase involved in polyketide biosynthesis [Saccharomonospora xinjiangensis XJ-54]